MCIPMRNARPLILFSKLSKLEVKVGQVRHLLGADRSTIISLNLRVLHRKKKKN